ncbi:MAG: hypothetical protein JRI45_09540, partial [Deltaproteobacteria bacterium]|nr:hypothetical protein [Deltaproteobacteria bacterium]
MKIPLIMMVQITLSCLLIGILIYLILRHSRVQGKIDRFLENFEKITQEQDRISKQFEANLEERKQVLQNLVQSLDERIKKAEELLDRMDSVIGKIPDEDELEPFSKNPEHAKILKLAQKGLTPQAISQHLQKPLGEIE